MADINDIDQEEFATGTGKGAGLDRLFGRHGTPGQSGFNTYTLPGVIPLDSNNLPIITIPNYWAISINLQYMHHFQVGAISFYDGGVQVSQLYGDVIDPGFICTQGISITTDYDLPPNTHLYQNVNDPTKKPLAPWIPPAQKMQFFMGLGGLGNITGANGVNGSSVTPEFYGYAIHKDEVYTTPALIPTTFEGLDFSLDTGDTPEAERATIKFDNSAVVDQSGNTTYLVDNYTTRGQIGVTIIDPSVTDPKAPDPTAPITLFEGVGYGQTSPESTGDNIIDSMTLPCRGMVDQLVRSKWTGNNPDFGTSASASGQGWLVGDVIRRCFAQAGFPASNVVIEEEATYLSQFRCWMGQQGGGPTSNNSPGEGHELQGIHTQWQPSGETAVNEFLDWFLRDIMGWHWHRSKRDKKWHVYRRPNPTNKTDVALKKFVPKCGFYRTVEKAQANPDNLPAAYFASHKNGHSIDDTNPANDTNNNCKVQTQH